MRHIALTMGRIKVDRWTILACTIVVESIGGLSYIFSLYSDSLKTKFQLTQTKLDLLGTLSNIGATVGLHIGLLTDRVGPRPVVALGGAMGFFGWGATFLALSPAVGWKCPYSILCLQNLLQGQQALTTDVAVVASTGRMFPEHRGLALGLAKSYVGLSGSLVTQAYQGVFRPHVASFMLFIVAAIPLAAGLYVCVYVELGPPRRETAESHARTSTSFAAALLLTGCLALALVASAMASQLWAPADTAAVRLALTVAVAVLFSGVLFFLATRSDGSAKARPDDAEEPLGAPLLLEDEAPPAPAVREYAFLETVRTLDFAILFLAFLCSSGPGLVLINNLGQIVPAVGGLRRGAQDTFVSILSVCNCLGRLTAGVAGDVVIDRWRLPRPLCFGAFCLLTVGAMLLLAVGTPHALYGATVLGGFAYGGLNGGIPPIYTELWGFRAFGAVYAAGSLAEGAASYLLATKLFGSFYDAEARRQNLPAGGACLGAECFRAAALAAAALAAFAALLSFWLAHRSRARYDALYPRKTAGATVQ